MAGGISRRIELVLGLVVICFCLSRIAEGVWIEIPSTGTKCVSEDIQTNVVVLADYTVTNEDSSSTTSIPHISVRVTSPYGNNLHHQENVTHGQFAFTTKEGGNYLACFWIEGNHQTSSSSATVNFNWRTGIAAKDWESVAKKDKIEGVELELRKLEGLVESIHGNLVYLKGREADMREVSESTNTRVAWFSIMSISLCVFVSVLQIWYLKTYFHKKKLI